MPPPHGGRLCYTSPCMDSKRLYLFGATVGGILGGCVPNLWHASALSFSGVVFSALGGLAGIWVCWRLTR